jgi:hypothetical protein
MLWPDAGFALISGPWSDQWKLDGSDPPGPVVGELLGDGDGDGELVVPPVQVTPFIAKLAGTGLLVFQVPLNPKLVLALVPNDPFQLALRAVTAAPVCVSVVFHAWVTCCPAENDQVSVQLLTGSPRLVRDTLAPKPPGHWLVVE